MTEICFLKFWSPKKSKTKVLGRFSFCWGFSFWLIYDYFLTVPPHGGERVIMFLVSLLIRAPILWSQGPTLMILYNLNYFHVGPVLKYSHIGY